MEVSLKIRILFFILFSFVFFHISAEEKQIEKTETKKVEISLNGGLSMKFSALGSNGGFLSSKSHFAYLLGFKAAVVFNKSWYVGGAAYFLGNEIKYHCDEIVTSKDRHTDAPCSKSWDGTIHEGDLSLGYGGVVAGYTFNIKSFFRVETGALIGGGRFSAVNGRGDYFHPESFFALEPEINLLFVITRYFAASINISYRLISGMGKSSSYSTADMSGPSIGLDIRLGSF